MIDPSFWGHEKESTDLLKELEKKRKLKSELDALEKKILDVGVTLELLDIDSSDLSLQLHIDELLPRIQRELKAFEIKSFLSDAYDASPCYLSLSSGAGGVDAMDWTEMLFRMYLGYCQNKGFNTTIMSMSEGNEAGIKSATIFVNSDFAYGFLKSEKGVHRLVRISPFDANKRRHTSFALVEVVPMIKDAAVQIDEKDLRIDTFNASGHGGQNVQKNDTAIRIVHLPSGIMVTCQSERSQLQNREAGMKVLLSKLASKMEELRLSEINELKSYVSAEWGNQIRSYVLQPYTMVKDNRTNYETADVTGVLEGNLDELVWEYLGGAK